MSFKSRLLGYSARSFFYEAKHEETRGWIKESAGSNYDSAPDTADSAQADRQLLSPTRMGAVGAADQARAVRSVRYAAVGVVRWRRIDLGWVIEERFGVVCSKN